MEVAGQFPGRTVLTTLIVAGLLALPGAGASRGDPEANPVRTSPDDCLEADPGTDDGPAGEQNTARSSRLSPAAAEALAALVGDSAPLPCGAIAQARQDGGHGEHGLPASGHDAHDHAPLDRPADPMDAQVFNQQWEAARQRAEELATPDAALEAGYVAASAHGPGVGAHWIDWTLIDAPFDPSRPSMLLFDQNSDPQRLAGFSYWVRSPDEPEGFAGDLDLWHRHFGLCFVNGWQERNLVPAAGDCIGGDWLNGSDLWMLHAWVVPELPNPNGPFADTHWALCPSEFDVPDIVSC